MSGAEIHNKSFGVCDENHVAGKHIFYTCIK